MNKISLIPMPERQLVWMQFTGKTAPTWKGLHPFKEMVGEWLKPMTTRLRQTLRHKGLARKETVCPDKQQGFPSACAMRWRGALCNSCQNAGNVPFEF